MAQDDTRKCRSDTCRKTMQRGIIDGGSTVYRCGISQLTENALQCIVALMVFTK
jgi:hypothetical protein